MHGCFCGCVALLVETHLAATPATLCACWHLLQRPLPLAQLLFEDRYKSAFNPEGGGQRDPAISGAIDVALCTQEMSKADAAADAAVDAAVAAAAAVATKIVAAVAAIVARRPAHRLELTHSRGRKQTARLVSSSAFDMATLVVSAVGAFSYTGRKAEVEAPTLLVGQTSWGLGTALCSLVRCGALAEKLERNRCSNAPHTYDLTKALSWETGAHRQWHRQRHYVDSARAVAKVVWHMWRGAGTIGTEAPAGSTGGENENATTHASMSPVALCAR